MGTEKKIEYKNVRNLLLFRMGGVKEEKRQENTKEAVLVLTFPFTLETENNQNSFWS